MVSVYKYVSDERFAWSLIEKGELYLRSLAYFRVYEDASVRGDPDDGKLRYQPEAGLTVTRNGGKAFALPPEWRFRSSVRAGDIFVYCLSLERSEALAAKFQSPFCVEIKNATRLFARTKSSIRHRSRLDRDAYGRPVEYRDLATAPVADWALPEKVAFLKPPSWSWQAEYRIVVGRKGAFAVENVELALESGLGKRAAAEAGDNPLIVRVGNLSRIAQLHRF